MKDRRRARVIIAPRTGTGRPCRPAKAGRHWSPGTAGSGRRPAPRRRKSSGRRRRRPTAARTVLHAAASGAARSRSAPPVQRRQPLPLRPEPRLRQVQPLLLHPRWRRRRLSRNRARVSPCSFPGIAGPARRQSARPRRLFAALRFNSLTRIGNRVRAKPSRMRVSASRRPSGGRVAA